MIRLQFVLPALALSYWAVSAFSPMPATRQNHHVSSVAVDRHSSVVLSAGGFEWEDPTEAVDQGVENPFKNPDLMKSREGEDMKIDPARLLGPRLNGSNLYLYVWLCLSEATLASTSQRKQKGRCFSGGSFLSHFTVLSLPFFQCRNDGKWKDCRRQNCSQA